MMARRSRDHYRRPSSRLAAYSVVTSVVLKVVARAESCTLLPLASLPCYIMDVLTHCPHPG